MDHRTLSSNNSPTTTTLILKTFCLVWRTSWDPERRGWVWSPNQWSNASLRHSVVVVVVVVVVVIVVDDRIRLDLKLMSRPPLFNKNSVQDYCFPNTPIISRRGTKGCGKLTSTPREAVRAMWFWLVLFRNLCSKRSSVNKSCFRNFSCFGFLIPFRWSTNGIFPKSVIGVWNR